MFVLVFLLVVFFPHRRCSPGLCVVVEACSETLFKSFYALCKFTAEFFPFSAAATRILQEDCASLGSPELVSFLFSLSKPHSGNDLGIFTYLVGTCAYVRYY